MLPELEPVVIGWREITNELVALARAMRADAWNRASASEGWTNKQLLIHLATGYRVRIARLERALSGVDAPDPDFNELNARAVALWQDRGIDEIVEELLRVRGSVLALIERQTEASLATPIETSLGRRALGDTIADMSHDLEHITQLQAAVPTTN